MILVDKQKHIANEKEQMKNIRLVEFFPLLLFIILLLPLLFFTSINSLIFLSLNQAAVLLPVALWANLTLLGDGVFLVGLLSVFAIRFPYFSAICLYCGMGMGLVVQILKRIIGQERPFNVLEGESINFIGEPLSHHSFPSGHSATVFFLAAAILCYFNIKNLWLIMLIIIIATAGAFSRIAVGVHFPADVLSGALIGWFIALVSITLLRHKRIAPPFMIIASVLILGTCIAMFFHDPKLPHVTILMNSAAIIFTSCAAYNLLKNFRPHGWMKSI